MSTPEIKPDDQAALLDAARVAAEPLEGFWDQVADYFDQQRGIVEPRDKQQKTNDF